MPKLNSSEVGYCFPRYSSGERLAKTEVLRLARGLSTLWLALLLVFAPALGGAAGKCSHCAESCAARHHGLACHERSAAHCPLGGPRIGGQCTHHDSGMSITIAYRAIIPACVSIRPKILQADYRPVLSAPSELPAPEPPTDPPERLPQALA